MLLAIVRDSEVERVGTAAELFPDTSFPVSGPPSDFMLERSVMPVAEDRPHDPALQKLVPVAPRIEGGTVYTVAVEPLSQAELDGRLASARQAAADRVRALRDRKMQEGGYQRNGKWFHSDLASRIQQLGLNMVGQGIPPNTRWKTMDGSFVTMTPNVAQGIFAAAMQQDLALFERGEQLIAAIDASSDPESIDITTGWPATFGGV